MQCPFYLWSAPSAATGPCSCILASYLFPVETYSGRSYYGGPDYMCEHCNAGFWYQERVVSLSSYAQKRIVYHSCCRGGRILLPKNRPFPPPLCDLIRFNGGPASKSKPHGRHNDKFPCLQRNLPPLKYRTFLASNETCHGNRHPGTASVSSCQQTDLLEH